MGDEIRLEGVGKDTGFAVWSRRRLFPDYGGIKRNPYYVSFIVSDMRWSLNFYRLLGLPIPEAADATQDHVEISVGGLRIAWESEVLMRQLDPGWTPPSRAGRLSFALEAASPAEVDAAVRRVEAAGTP